MKAILANIEQKYGHFARQVYALLTILSRVIRYMFVTAKNILNKRFRENETFILCPEYHFLLRHS